LDETGEAYRYDVAVHCAYYLRMQSARLMIWRWSHVATEQEASRMHAKITSLDGPLDAHRANRFYEYATRRSVSNPRPMGRALHVVDFADYPVLAAASDS
jgi:hypothetical protein